MARAAGHIADGFQAGAAQARDHGRLGAERRHRQRPDRIGFLAGADDAAMGMTGQRPRAHGGAGDGGADRKTLRGQHAAHQPHHRGLAAEQMHAAGDVEKQAVRGIERHQRGETVAPRRQWRSARRHRRPHRHRTPAPAGQMARALASGRPTSRPRRAAASSSAKICSALFCFATTMLGSLLFPPPLWGRVGRGWRQRRCLWLTSPPPSQPTSRREGPHHFA